MTMRIFNIFAVVCLIASILTFGFINANADQPVIVEVTDACLNCICKAISNCNLALKCDDDKCGPLGITKPYWMDSYRPIIENGDPNDEQAYEKCTVDICCAKTSARKYFSRYPKDCNGDKIIDCIDYAAIHKLGPNACSGKLDRDYSNTINSCVNHQP